MRLPDASRLRGFTIPRWVWVVTLLVFAIVWYAGYVRHGINFRDEGGTVTLVAQRLLEGEVPMKDVSLGGYNVLWFYPIVGLFKVFGVSFVLARGYCLALSVIAAVLVFLIVESAGRVRWLAFLVALLAVVVPGMTFKNYNPFLTVLNTWLLMSWALVAPGSGAAWRRMIAGGVALGVTYLIRIDLGLFFTVLWIGGLMVSALSKAIAGRTKLANALGGPVLIVALVLAVHTPVLMDAKRRGYAEQFANQYSAWPKMISENFQQRILGRKAGSAAVKDVQRSPNGHIVRKAERAVAPKTDRLVLTRQSWLDSLRGDDPAQRKLAFLLYAPLVSLVPLALLALVKLAANCGAERGVEFQRGLAALLFVGGALTMFPQYFFFRPDSPHLSEFSPCFWAAAFGAPLLLRSPESRWLARGQWAYWLLMVWLAVHAFVFLQRMATDRWTGAFWQLGKSKVWFDGQNGVDIYVRKKDLEPMRRLHDVVRHYAKPEDWVVAYPYHPSVNVLADRRTYEWNVYIDNATRTKDWDAKAIERFETKRPAVIVFSEWAVNGHDASKFENFAPRATAWVRKNYPLAEKIQVGSDVFHIHVRRDLLSAGEAGEELNRP